MKAMRSRISLLLIAGLVGAIQPASAGTWTAEVQFACTAKQISAGPGLYYPTTDPPRIITYTIFCGKGKPPKHVIAPSPGTPDFCQMSQTSVNGKKPTKLKIVNGGASSTCSIGMTANMTGSCGVSDGTFKATISHKNGKVITVDGTWNDEIGGHAQIIGTSRSPKPGIFFGDAQITPDRTNKDESCVPSITGQNPTGANGFKLQGVATVTGTKAK